MNPQPQNRPFTPSEEIEAAQRRGARITAMRAGKDIPNPESAEADARPGNSDDEAVLAMLRGRAQIPGASTSQPAVLLAANEVLCSRIGPQVSHPHYLAA